MDGYMNLQEAAAKLGLKSADGLRRQAINGVLRAEKIGAGRHGVWLVHVDEVERYRREHLGQRTGFHDPKHPRYGEQGPGRGRPKRKSAPDAPESPQRRGEQQ
jgi:hypothetical protein